MEVTEGYYDCVPERSVNERHGSMHCLYSIYERPSGIYCIFIRQQPKHDVYS
jgi:hypothetical protein